MSNNKTYNQPQDIDTGTLVEVLDLFTDFTFRFDGAQLRERFMEIYGEHSGSHFYRKLVTGDGQYIKPSKFLELYNSMTRANRLKLVQLVLQDRHQANKDYLTALPVDYRGSSNFSALFAPFESLHKAIETINKVEPIMAGMLAETLTQQTAIAYRREGVES